VISYFLEYCVSALQEKKCGPPPFDKFVGCLVVAWAVWLILWPDSKFSNAVAGLLAIPSDILRFRMKMNMMLDATPMIITVPMIPPAVAGTFNFWEDSASGGEDAVTMLDRVLEVTSQDGVHVLVDCVVVDAMTKSGL